jgi:predicted secreted protein
MKPSAVLENAGSVGRLFPSRWDSRLVDARGKRVVFLAHCLLNQNTRYLGGALSAGAVSEVLQACLARGVGIVQLPCPEEQAWGGVLKRRLLRWYGAQGRWWYALRGLLLPLGLCYTRFVYRRLARATAAQIEDYQRAGIQVLGVVGVDGSPSCGVRTTLDVNKVAPGLASLDWQTVNTQGMNRLITQAAVVGPGWYMQLLQAELDRRGLKVAMTAHDLIAALEGAPSSMDIEKLLDQPRNEVAVRNKDAR